MVGHRSRCQPPLGFVSVDFVLRTAVDQREVAERLAAIGCVAADEEAAELVDAARDREELDTFLMRRAHGEPLAWITGWTRFCGNRVRVDEGVYVPRFETEELARRAAAVLSERGGRAVDLCTGTGAVAVALMSVVSGAGVVAVDLDPRAAACARRNGVRVVVGDMGEALRTRSFDVVTAIAPYVPTDQLAYLPSDVQRYEPRRALDGGDDGLEILRRAVADAARILRPRGQLFVELGADQDEGLAPALTGGGFEVTATWCDEDGDLRGLAACLVRS